MKSKALIWLLTAIMAGNCQVAAAQHLGWEANAQGFFDNSEGDDKYRQANTFGGIHLQPLLSLSTDDGRHRLVAGYNALIEFGKKPTLDADGLVGYYQYQGRRTRFLLGKYPRRMQREAMRDYLLMDSLRYFRPLMTGVDVLCTSDAGYIEFFLDWTFKRDTDVREQFMTGVLARYETGGLQMGVNGYYYHYARKLIHDEKEGVHDNLLAHPYLGTTLQRPLGLDSMDIRTGVLLNVDRDRGMDNKLHTAIGFLGEADVYWKRLVLNQLFYLGKRQQHYGDAGNGKYYWGDSYYRSPWYARTDLSYIFLNDSHASLRAGVVLHFADGVFRWNQLLTLTFSLGKR